MLWKSEFDFVCLVASVGRAGRGAVGGGTGAGTEASLRGALRGLAQ